MFEFFHNGKELIGEYYWNNPTIGKVRQRIVRYIGVSANEAELAQLKEIGEFLKTREADARQPGLFPPEQVAEIFARYRGLWRVKRGFRVNKHDLKVRPIHHWTPRRIRAHLAIAYMAFACVRHLAYRVRLQKKRSLSPEEIRSRRGRRGAPG